MPHTTAMRDEWISGIYTGQQEFTTDTPDTEGE